jgi:hypothetical protein
LLRDVGKLIGQPADSIAVRLVALARLKMDATEAQLLSGDPAVTVQDITALEEVFAKYVPKPGMNLKVSFVSGVVGMFKCQHCHMENRVEDYRGPEPKKTDSQNAVAQPSVSAPASGTADAVPASPANVIPLDPAQRAAELRAAARVSNNVDPGPPAAPRVNYNNPDNESISAFNRRVDAAYRV